MLSTDLESLAAILAKRTPGEVVIRELGYWYVMVGEKVLASFMSKADCDAWFAAVNACGPLLERVRTLEAEVERLRPLAESQEIENKVIEEMFG